MRRPSIGFRVVSLLTDGTASVHDTLQASRQTELQREFPIHVVCSWLGNSPQVAQQSYLLVTEDDFARGAGTKIRCLRAPTKTQSTTDFGLSIEPRSALKLG